MANLKLDIEVTGQDKLRDAEAGLQRIDSALKGIGAANPNGGSGLLSYAETFNAVAKGATAADTEYAKLEARFRQAPATWAGAANQLQEVGGAVNSLVQNVTKYWGVLAAGFGLGSLIKETISYTSTLADLSDRTGMTIKDLQGFELAGSLVGVSLEKIASAMNQFQNRLEGGNDKTMSALGMLKLDAEELGAMNPGQQLKEIASAMSGIVDPAERSHIAMSLFGKSGAQLLPLLNDNLQTTISLFERMGLVLEENAVRGGDSLDDFVTVATKVLRKGIADRLQLERLGKDIAHFVADDPAPFGPGGAARGGMKTLGTATNLPWYWKGQITGAQGGALSDRNDLLSASYGSTSSIEQAIMRDIAENKRKTRAEKPDQWIAGDGLTPDFDIYDWLEKNAKSYKVTSGIYDPTSIGGKYDIKAPEFDVPEFIAGDGLTKGFFSRMFGGAGFGKDLGQVLLQAFTGGGDVGKSLGGFFGGKAGGMFGGMLGTSGLGSILGSVLPGIGTLLGGLAGGLFGKLFGPTQWEKDNRANQESLTQIRGGVNQTQLQSQLDFTGSSWSASSMLGVKDAGALKTMLDDLQGRTDRLNSAMDKYGISWEQLGERAKQAKVNADASELIQDFEVLQRAGADVSFIIEKMGSNINSFVQSAVRTGTEVPNAMKPMLDKMLEMGLLTDAAGNQLSDLSSITFSTALPEALKSIADSINNLASALGVASGAAGAARNNLGGGSAGGVSPSTGGEASLPIVDLPPNFGDGGYSPDPYNDRYGRYEEVYHQGGFVGGLPRFHGGGLMSDERLAVLQTGEYVMSRNDVASARRGGGGGGTAIIMLDGKVLAKAIVPRLPGEVRRHVPRSS